MKTNQLTLYKEIIPVCFNVHRKHLNAPYRQHLEFLNVEICGT
jgi:hypothetical protein